MFARFFWYWLQLHSNQWLPIQELEKIQLKKLKKVLSYSYDKVPFYRKYYDQHGVHPNDLKSLEDIRRFPIITKELARDTPLEERMSEYVQYEVVVPFLEKGLLPSRQRSCGINVIIQYSQILKNIDRKSAIDKCEDLK